MNKTFVLLLILIMLSFLSCDKNDTKTLQSVVGEWKWVKSAGGITGSDVQTPESTGINKTFIFKDKGEFLLIENTDTTQHTDYFTSREISILYNDSFDFVTVNYKFYIYTDFEVTLPMRYIIQQMDDSLIIVEDVYDGYYHRFLRKE